ncbi:LysR family transcriptional regulator [Shewanella dokdonensis]|uniref:LysR family transcriptional regulator n=1 Tax=Shewanella dokdonensis TaxID=712036 RepID=A0ABX8DJN0_9GAMM|nr:LysR family transcriptional regulator [Shewanella dokdonensis]MCL1074335.1 LysR family transcriptional regulator [Shewanella dokdonensis]QVK24022.1 LysR family transcriptional regulator [Shewanella dokdonensis]
MLRALQDLQIFVETARQGSLSSVARAMNLTPAATSAAIKRLEQQLGAPLFIRSTRSLRLTKDGEHYLQYCEQALLQLELGENLLRSGRETLQGKLHLSLPSDLGRNLLAPLLDCFMATHPQVELKLQMSDHLTNIYRQPVDLVIRYGQPPDSALIALPLRPDNDRVLCASPDYIARYGAPMQPQELYHHNCLCFMLADTVHDRWQFTRAEEFISINVKGNRIADDGDMVHRWAIAGCGIAYKSRLDIAADLAQGKLIQVCPDWQGEAAPLNMLLPDRRQLTSLIKALRSHLLQHLPPQTA